MNGLSNLWGKLSNSKKYREAFVATQLKRGIPSQIRILLKQRGWKQEDLARYSGLTQGAVSRATNPDYGNLTFNTILKIAAGFDIAFVGKFVPFNELARWYDSLSEESLKIPSFNEDHLAAQDAAKQNAIGAAAPSRFLAVSGIARKGAAREEYAGAHLAPAASNGIAICPRQQGAMGRGLRL